MAANTFKGHVLTGTAAARPSASSVPEGTLYAATDTRIIYQAISGSWGVWMGGVVVLSYVEFTGNPSVTSTTAATPTTVVTAGAITADGVTPICVEFFSPGMNGPSATQSLIVGLYEGGTQLGSLAASSNAGGIGVTPTLARRFFTPTSGSHTYSVGGYMGAAGTGTVRGDTGVGTAYVPGYIRITTGS